MPEICVSIASGQRQVVADTLSQAEGRTPLSTALFDLTVENTLSGCPVLMQETVYWRARVPWQEGLPAKDRNIT